MAEEAGLTHRLKPSLATVAAGKAAGARRHGGAEQGWGETRTLKARAKARSPAPWRWTGGARGGPAGSGWTGGLRERPRRSVRSRSGAGGASVAVRAVPLRLCQGALPEGGAEHAAPRRAAGIRPPARRSGRASNPLFRSVNAMLRAPGGLRYATNGPGYSNARRNRSCSDLP